MDPMKRFSFKNIQFLRWLRYFLVFSGIIFFVVVMLAFTTAPFYLYHWLGTGLPELKEKPEVIVMLGGSGMPSESNLIRSWYAASAAASFPGSRLVVAMPGDPADSTGTPARLKRELEIRGVDSGRLVFELEGTNTRSQALRCRELLDANQPVWLITSPEHMRRSLLCFRKAGFTRIGGLPAFENPSEADFSFSDDELGGKPTLLPDVGHNMQVRYEIWTQLKYEILIARELLALGYYRLRGWI